jgi:hypothetical protein
MRFQTFQNKTLITEIEALKFWATSVIIGKLHKVIIHPLDKNWPNLAICTVYHYTILYYCKAITDGCHCFRRELQEVS